MKESDFKSEIGEAEVGDYYKTRLYEQENYSKFL